MNQNEFATHYHRMVFENRCFKSKGTEFQTFFEDIMRRADPTFVPVRPSGQEGDWKCDGFSGCDGSVYQCYAPDEVKDKDTANKIHTDFEGARTHWQQSMKRWVFVWGADERLPPQALGALEDLRRGNHGVTIIDWSRDALERIVLAMLLADRIALLGPVPEITSVVETTAVEIQELLIHVAHDITYEHTGFASTGIAEKIKRNNLSSWNHGIIQMSIPIAVEVDRYLNRQADVEFPSAIAKALVDKYEELAMMHGENGNRIFEQLVQYVQGPFTQGRYYWAAVGIVNHYFQLCDIFKR